MRNHAHGMVAARWTLALCAAVLMMSASIGVAQTPDDTPEQQMENFIHYTLVAKPGLAEAYARALLDRGLSDAEIANVIDEGNIDEERYNRAMQRAFRVPELREVAGELETRVENGRLAQAREAERIAEAIRMLVEHQRARDLGHNRLMAAGEYAVPALLRAIEETNDQRLRNACVAELAELGGVAVTPLSVALPHLGDPVVQRVIVDLLGRIGHPHAAPALRELSADDATPEEVRRAAQAAFSRVGGVDLSLSDLYAALGMRYFMNQMALIAYPGDPTNNVWAYDAHAGLVWTAVPTPVFGQVMAMRHAQRALAYEANNAAALSLFVAANLKRENDLPAGASDPIFGDLPYTPSFYATIFGSQVCQDVLAVALDTVDTQLVRDAIRALSQTTGGANLFAARSGRQPLLEALRYPDRRVQYDAALVLGRALPRQTFAGDFSVVPLLASAVRTSGQSFAAIVAPTDEDRRSLRGSLEAQGFTIIGAEARFDLLADAISRATAIDLIVAQAGTQADARAAIAATRDNPRTVATPIVVLVPAVDEPRLELQHRGDRGVRIATLGGDAQLRAVVENTMQRAVGGRMSGAEADQYAFEALRALRDIAISGSQVYNIADAEASLLDSLASRTGGARLYVAEILAMIDSQSAQQAIFSAAINAQEIEQVELLNHTAASIRRFGSHAQPQHISALLSIIQSSTGEVAEAAARVHGALNAVPTPGAIDLVVNPGG